MPDSNRAMIWEGEVSGGVHLSVAIIPNQQDQVGTPDLLVIAGIQGVSAPYALPSI